MKFFNSISLVRFLCVFEKGDAPYLLNAKKLSVVLCRFIWKLSCSVSQSCPRIIFVNRPFTFLYIAWAQKRFSTLGSYLFRNARILFYISMFLIYLSINEFWNFIDSKASSWLLGRSGSPVGGVERIEVKGHKNSSHNSFGFLPCQSIDKTELILKEQFG